MYSRPSLTSKLFLYFFLLISALLAACGGGNSDSPTLTAVEVTPSTTSIANGTAIPFIATALYSDGGKSDVTQAVTWTSSDTSIATVSNAAGNQGVAQATGLGSATITATYQGTAVGTAHLTVTAATITGLAITPSAPSLANGTTQTFVATATFTDNSHQTVTNDVTWTSSDTTVATISNTSGSNGIAQSLKQGTSTITASYMGRSAMTVLTVTPATIKSLAVTPATASIANGTTQAFVATATFTDNSHQTVTAGATWTSSDPSVATISNTSGSNGVAQSLKQGTSTITASYMGQSATAMLSVTPAVLSSLTITPANPTVAKGFTQPFTAMGTYTDNSQQNLSQSVIWSSSNSAVATISNAAGSSGQATTLGEGTTTITAASGDIQASTILTVGAAALASISITPSSPSVPKGTTQQLTATGIYSDNSHQDLTTSVTWASSDTGISDVSNAAGSQGDVAAKAVGNATVTATSGTVSGSTVVTVSSATLVSLQVTPASSSLAAGFTRQFTATGIYSDNSNRDITDQVTWVSTNSSAATISNASGSAGLASGATAGSTTITAQSGSISGSSNLTVTAATLTGISITPSSQTLPKGRSQQYTAIGTFSDNSTQDLTSQVVWKSRDDTIATINSSGLSKAVAASGNVTISAISTTPSSGTVSGAAALNVTNADIVSMTVAPNTASVPKGTTQQFTAQAQYSDGTSGTVTQQVSWTSSDDAVATVSSDTQSAGLATGAGTGSASITAKIDDFSGNTVTGTATLTVTSAVLTTIAISPEADSVAKGIAVQYSAKGMYSDLSTKDLTSSVTWSSSDTSIASISNAGGSQGFANTLKVGQSTIEAIINDTSGNPISASTSLSVTAAVLQTIDVTPANSTIGQNSSQPFTATGTYSDSTTANLTTQVTWSTSDAAVADISNSTGSHGVAYGKAQGTVTIHAVDASSGVSGQTGLTVGVAALQSITIVPLDSTNGNVVPNGYSKQFKAIGHYADNSTQDLTKSVTWTSFNPAVLTVSNTVGAQGIVTGVSPGMATLTVQNGSISAELTVTVTSASISSIAVTPANVTLSGSGKTQQYTAIATFSDNETLDVTTQVTWSSSNTSAATISNADGSQGLATSKLEVVTTQTTIGATINGKTGSTTLNVAF